jgi:hypothetical protein
MKTYHKPGTAQYRVAPLEDKEFLKNFGWELMEVKTAKTKTAPVQPAGEEVSDDVNKGE